MSLWLPRTSPALLSRRLLLRSSPSLHLHLQRRRLLSSNNPANPTPRPLDSPTKPSLPSTKDAAHASLMTRAWKKIRHEAAHYWNGTKLLVSEVRISSRLQWKILQGETLTRRERRQVSASSIRLTKYLNSPLL